MPAPARCERPGTAPCTPLRSPARTEQKSLLGIQFPPTMKLRGNGSVATLSGVDTMELIFRGRHLALRDEFREYASKRLSRLSRHLPLAEPPPVAGRRAQEGADG